MQSKRWKAKIWFMAKGNIISGVFKFNYCAVIIKDTYNWL